MERHLNDRAPNHNIVELDLALIMQADPSLVSTNISELIKIDEALNFIDSRSDRIKRFKNKLIIYKERLFGNMRKILNLPITAIQQYDE